MKSLDEYDRFGRRRFNPELHHNMGKSWLVSDQAYLVAYYNKVPIEQLELALGRTTHSLRQRMN
jgi:hypothetical protein